MTYRSLAEAVSAPIN